jgi:LuxR family quorum sensing-dependent transcriptional regulator
MPELRDDYRNRILDFIDGMRDVRASAEICRCMTREVGRMGYCFVSIWEVPKAGQSLKNSVLFNSRPREYTERYLTKNYVAIDPLVRTVRRTLAPAVWSDIPATEISREAAQIFHEANESGATNGIVVPIVSASGSISIFSASGDGPDISVGARRALEIIGIFSHQFLQRAARVTAGVSNPPTSTAPLTNREREILTWSAFGRGAGEIGDILGISERTVRFHIGAAIQKLGAANKTQAVALAVVRHLIQL